MNGDHLGERKDKAAGSLSRRRAGDGYNGREGTSDRNVSRGSGSAFHADQGHSPDEGSVDVTCGGHDCDGAPMGCSAIGFNSWAQLGARRGTRKMERGCGTM